MSEQDDINAAILTENQALRRELGRLQQQIIDEQRDAGGSVRALINRYRALANLPPAVRARQVAFLHIGKAGGTSIHCYLRQSMPEVPVFHASPELFDSETPETISEAGLVLGHFSWNHVNKLRRPYFLLTFLRDPIERVLSSYYFLREAEPDEDPRSANSLSKSLTLEGFLECDVHSVRKFTQDHQAHTLTDDFSAPRREDRDKLAEEALANLRSCDFVGFVECFDQSLERLASVLGLPRPSPLHLNRTRNRLARAEVSKDAIRMIRTLNRADVHVYNIALSERGYNRPGAWRSKLLGWSPGRRR